MPAMLYTVRETTAAQVRERLLILLLTVPRRSVVRRFLPHFRHRRTNAATPARGVPLRPDGLRFRAPVGVVFGRRH